MSSRQHSINVSTITGEGTPTHSESLLLPDSERWQTVLDDPSFRRLLRDGHHAETTTALLSQLENKE